MLKELNGVVEPCRGFFGVALLPQDRRESDERIDARAFQRTPA